MYDFTYQRPATVADAVKLLGADSEAKALAGGQTLIPTLKQRLAQPTSLIDLGAIAELKGIALNGKTLTIGAGTTHAEVAASADVAKAIPALAHLAGDIGDAQVRNRGTIGGSIANADPAADYPAAIVALGATVKTNKREIKGDDFFKGLFTTALQDGEIVVSVSFPVPDKAAYVKFPQPASRFALVGVFVAKTGGAVRLAVTGAGPSVFRLPGMENALAKSFAPAAIDGITVETQHLNEDIHASKAYRAHLVGVIAKRAVQAAG
jgi:carbon-monoxide dehydrogenase medium subunit